MAEDAWADWPHSSKSDDPEFHFSANLGKKGIRNNIKSYLKVLSFHKFVKIFT